MKTNEAGSSGAAKFPERAVEGVVPFAAGGSTDLIGRMLAKSLEKPLCQTVLVVNKEGAAGAVGTKEVITGAPDGHRMAPSGELRRLAVFTEARMKLLPDVPTVKEKDVDVVVDQMRFVVVPPKVTDDVAKVLENAFREAVKTPEYDKFLTDNYIDRHAKGVKRVFS